MSRDALPGPARALGESGHLPHFGALAVKLAAGTSLAWSVFSKASKFMLDLALDQVQKRF